MPESGPLVASELQFGGPGQPPQAWIQVGGVAGGAIKYDGAVIVPANVAGGPQGPGTLNVNDLYIKGIRLQNLVGGFLPLTGGTLTGPLVINGPSNFQLGFGQTGQVLASDGSGNTYWTDTPPGGPYLLISGGTLTGALKLTDDTSLLIGGGNPGQVLQTDGNSNLTWVNPGGAGSLPPAGPVGYLLATDGAETPYWTADLPGGPYAPAVTGGYLPLSGGTVNGTLNITGPFNVIGSTVQQGNWTMQGTLSTFVITKGASNARPIYGANANLNRWSVVLGDATPEPGGGANAGANFAIQNYTDAGAILNTPPPFSIDRASGKVSIPNLTAPGLHGTNRIINGDMFINQRGVLGSATVVGYTIDRWNYGGPVSKGSWNQNDNGTTGAIAYKFSLGWTSSGAYTPAITDYFEFYQIIEADMVTDFMWGTANAQPITLSFWFYANNLGTYSGSIRNAAGNRSYVFSFSYAALTWTKYSITIPGDTAGTWVMAGNAGSVNLTFDLGSGSNYHTNPGSWQAGNYLGATGTFILPSLNGAAAFYTGVKIEIGSVSTPFARETLSKRMADCQRYYQYISVPISEGYNAAGGFWYATFGYMTWMRAVPSVTFGGITYSNASALTLNAAYQQSIMTRITITAAGPGYATFSIAASAEL